MEPKKTSGKSNARLFVEEMFPGVVISGEIEYQADVILEDTMQFLQSLDITGGLTYNDLVICIAKAAEFYLGFTNCKIYGLAFDKQEYVPSTKKQEQDKRDTSVQLGTFISEGNNDDVIDGDIQIPETYRELLSDRAGYRRKLIRWICDTLLEDKHTFFFIPDGKYFVLSGHPDHNAVILVSSTHEAVYKYPNTQGEGEMQIFYVFHKLQQDFPFVQSLDIISTDTDIMMIGLLYIQKHNITTKTLLWKYAPKHTWMFYRDNPNYDFDKHIHLNKLHDAVTFELRSIVNPIESFVCAILMAGSDYTYGFRGVVHATILRAYFDFKTVLGDLYTDRHVNGETFTKLLIISYLYSSTRKNNRSKFTSGDINLQKIRSHKTLSKKFPSHHVLCGRIMHLFHYFTILRQMDVDFPQFLNPLHYGYDDKCNKLFLL